MKKLKVFIVDDSEENNFYVEDLISENEKIGEIECFIDSEEALEKLINMGEGNPELPDLILLDVRMPDMDGFEFIDELDENFKKFTPVVVILTSSRHRRDTESFGKQFLAKEFLNKPLESDQFNELINKYF